MRSKIFIIILLVLGFATRFMYFGWPNQVVFDEVYFGKYAIEYTTGTYFFDPHPPLGKLILASAAAVAPQTIPLDSFQTIGLIYPNSTYEYLRFLPTLLGALLPLIIYLIARKLLKSDVPAFIAGLFTVFETLFIVQSRFIFIDIFLVFFGMLGVLFFLYYRDQSHLNKNPQNRDYILLILSIVFISLAMCVKWTGLSYIALVGLIDIFDLYKQKEKISKWLTHAALFVGIFTILYVAFFAIHFTLLIRSGEGDAFMSPQFQKTLIGNPYENQNLPTISFFDKINEIHKVMIDSEAGLATAPHSYGSEWYTWPLMTRPIYYWVGQINNETSRIYLFGNVFILWLSTVAVGALFIQVVAKIAQALKTKTFKKILFVEIFLLIAYAGNLLPFIGIHRVMFLYHYFSALIFAYIILAYELSLVKNIKFRIILYSVVVCLGLVGYIYFFPIIYGTPLNDDQYMSKVWLDTWL